MLPEIKISDSLVLPTYFLYLSLMFSCLTLLLPWWANKQQMSVKISMNLLLLIMLSGFVGARLFHVFYESWDFYKSHPERILYFWYGGFVFLGGALLSGLACWLYLKKIREPFLKWADFVAPIAALFYGLGRISCLLSGCCYGKVCNLPWAIAGKHPTQIYAALWEISIAVIVYKLNKKQEGLTFKIWLVLHCLGRLIMEYFRDDFRGQFIYGFSISSWICLIILATVTTDLTRAFNK